MTLQEIRNDVLARIGPDHEITNGQIDTFINEGYHHVIAKIVDDCQDYFGDTETITTVVGTQEYTPTKEFITVRFVDYDPGTGTFIRATFIPLNEINSLQDPTDQGFTNSYPRYYMWGNKIGILPVPTTAGSVIIHGIVKPADLSSNSDVPAFISTHHNLLTTWAIKCLVESVDENYLDGARKKLEFEDGCDEMLRLIGARQSDVTKRITVTPLY
jgi:hypothetical protein